MKKYTLLAVFLSLGFIGPGFSAQAEDSPRAQKSGGGGSFTECAAVRLKEINIKHLGSKKKTTKLPAGWTVVGTAGGDGHPKVLVCR